MVKPIHVIMCAAALTLAACSEDPSGFDVSRQIGPNPVLPPPNPEFLARVKIAEVVGWPEGAVPRVAEGLKATLYTRDVASPRNLHTLPNGDVLVVQSRAPEGKLRERPKDFIRDWLMKLASGGPPPQGVTNRISLMRDLNRDGTVDEHGVLLDELHSPFGVAFADNTLYVAVADAILAYPYTLGQPRITVPPRVLAPLPGGPINHHWTKDLALSPDGRFLYASVGSNSNVGEHGLEAEKGRAAIWQVDRATGAMRL